MGKPISQNISEGILYNMNLTFTNLDSGYNRQDRVNQGEVKIDTDLPFVDKVCRGEMLPEEMFRDFGRADFAFHLHDLRGVARRLPRPIIHLLCRSTGPHVQLLQWLHGKEQQQQVIETKKYLSKMWVWNWLKSWPF